MKSQSFSLIITLVLTSVFSLPIMADKTDDLTAVIKRRVAVVTGLLHNTTMGKKEKDVKIIESVEELVDFSLMAKLSLGAKRWRQLDGAKQKEYADIFVKRVKKSYLEKLYLYTDEKILVKQGAYMTKKVKGVQKIIKSRIEVPSYIIGKTDQTELLYKFYKTKQDKWLVYDIEIAGVSIVQTYRAQFAEVLKGASIDKLIGKLASSEPL